MMRLSYHLYKGCFTFNDRIADTFLLVIAISPEFELQLHRFKMHRPKDNKTNSIAFSTCVKYIRMCVIVLRVVHLKTMQLQFEFGNNCNAERNVSTMRSLKVKQPLR